MTAADLTVVGLVDPLTMGRAAWVSGRTTQLLAYHLRQFGAVKVRLNTVHVSGPVARARIASAARLLGIRITTKLHRRHRTGEAHDYMLGTVCPLEDR